MLTSTHHVDGEHRGRQIPPAPCHVGPRPHQGPRSPLLFSPEEDDLQTKGQFRGGQQARQFQRHSHPRSIVVSADAALAAFGVIVSTDEDPAVVLRTSPQPDDVAGDAIPLAERKILLQSRLVAELN